MKKELSWQIALGIILVGLSAIVYFVHYLIFHDAHHIFIYLLGDIGFLFLEVLLVTLVLHQLLGYREKKAMINKMNMVIGAFFSEVGTSLLKNFSRFNTDIDNLSEVLVLKTSFNAKDFIRIQQDVKRHNYKLDIEPHNLDGLRDFLKQKSQFILNLLQNPNLLEHKSFTNLLWAILHLTEELVNRKTLQGLTETDISHLAGDIKRAYIELLFEWIAYLKHLQSDYPYLFSLAVRTNPFDKNATVEIK